MPSDICNKEITIRGREKKFFFYWNRKRLFIQYLLSEPIGSCLKQCKPID